MKRKLFFLVLFAIVIISTAYLFKIGIIENSTQTFSTIHSFLISEASSLKVSQPTQNYEVSFSYKIIGEQLPYPPKISFYFPNGTVYTTTLGISLWVPSGTVYSIERVINGTNGVRWATDNDTLGIITNSENLTIVYYEQFNVTFNYQVIGGGIYGPPTVTYYSFGSPNSAIVPATVWVDYNSTYTYPQQLPGSNSQERWIALEYFGKVNSSGTILVTYYHQYYVNVVSLIPTYALIDYVFKELISGWYNAGTIIIVQNITYYNSSLIREIITSVSPSSFIVLNSPITINVNVITQYYVNVSSPIPVQAIINGVSKTLTSGWYNSGTTITVENTTYYNSANERQVITYIYPRSVVVENPTIIVIKTITQYYVNVSSPIPVYALVNGINTTLTSGWYDIDTNVLIENITYYNSPIERQIIVNISPAKYLIITSPINISITTTTQYYINVSSPIPIYAIIIKNLKVSFVTSNGTLVYIASPIQTTLTLLSSGWYDKGIGIVIFNSTYYPSPFEREIIISMFPNISASSNAILYEAGIAQFIGANSTAMKMITLDDPLNVVVKIAIQYYVRINSPIPVRAIVNGKAVILNSSWLNYGTNVTIINYTYYASPTERYVIVGILPSLKINVTKPINVTLNVIKQYLVMINGEIKWVNAGSKISLNATIPFYEIGKFVGTYNTSPGSTVVVNGPVIENLVETLNYNVAIPILVVIITLIAVIGVLMITRK